MKLKLIQVKAIAMNDTHQINATDKIFIIIYIGLCLYPNRIVEPYFSSVQAILDLSAIRTPTPHT